jgi:hypothetical protein
MIPNPADRLRFVRETLFPKPTVMVQIARDNAWHAEGGLALRRLLQALRLLGAGLKQAAACRAVSRN